jgi:Pyruvate/2-oxoacid:ferredoxin oxidoreductase gamma subunit
MKKMTLNQKFNHPDHLLMLGKSTLLMTKKLLLSIMVALFVTSTLQAQEAGPVVHMDQFLASLTTQNSLAKSTKSELTKVLGLLKDLQPTVYLTDGKAKVKGVSPTSIVTNVSSLGALTAVHSADRESIEIATIKIGSASELGMPVNLALFSSFPNLRYIYIVSEVNSTADAITGMVQNNDPQYRVFYNILIAN